MEHAHLALYEDVAAISGDMAAAARASDWDRLAELERRYMHGVARLMDRPAPALSPEQRARKIGIIHDILAHDREIRDRVTPWMRQLATLIGTVRNERKLVGAYGA